MKKYKLLYFVSEDQYFLSHKIDQAQSALKKGFDILIICKFLNHEKKIRKLGFKTKNIDFIRGSLNPLIEIKNILDFFFTVLKFKPDIIQSIALKPILYSSLISILTKKTKLIMCIVGLGFLFIDKRISTRILKFTYIFLIKTFLVKKNTSFVFQNNEDKDQIKSLGLIKNSRTFIIRGSGINTNKFKTKNIKKKYDLIFHSRILYDKGFLELIEALRYLKHTTKLNVLVIGDTDKENKSSINVEKLKDWNKEKLIIWKGKQKNVLPFLQISKIAILPSYREGLPKSLLEAASCELPIITSDVPGCKDICINNYNGLLVPPKNSELLAMAIKKLLFNPKLARKFGKNGRKLVEEKFSTKIVNEGFFKLYKKII